MELRKFNSIASKDNFHTNRNRLRDNYTWLENYCKENYGKGNYLDWIADKINLCEGNQEIIKDLVELDTIRSNSLNFEVNPTVESATNFLRQKLINPKVETNYNKGESRAIFELLNQIRDNLTHQGKFELHKNQYQRNFKIVKIGADLSDSMIEKIENCG